MLLHFGGENCRPCRQLEKFVFNHPSVIDRISRGVVPVKIDDQQQPELFAQFGIQRIPQDLLVTHDGQVVMKRMSPDNSDGYLRMMDQAHRIATALATENSGEIQQVSGQQQTGSESAASNAANILETAGNVQRIQQRDLELRQQYFAARTPSGNDSQFGNFQPPTPTHSGPSHSGPTHMAPSHQAPSHQAPQHQMPRVAAPAHQMPRSEFQPEWNQTSLSNQVAIGGSATLNSGTDSQSTVAPAPQQQRISNRHFANNAGIPPQQNGTHSPSRWDRTPNFDSPAVGPPVSGQPNVTQNQNGYASLPPSQPKVIRNQFIDSPLQPGSSNRQLVQNPAAGSRQIGSQAQSNPSVAQSSQPATQKPLAPALQGYCPVTLMKEGRWNSGDPRWGCYHRGKLFLFASAEYREQFLASPDDLAPLLVGYDPVLYRDQNSLVEGKLNTGIFVKVDGRQHMVLFSSEHSKEQFSNSPRDYIESIRAAMSTTRDHLIR